MIRLSDASILALTKLRTRRIRLTITVVISSLLLAVLSLGLTVSAGIFKSIDDFSHQGLNDRYLVGVAASENTTDLEKNESVIARANQLRAEQIAAKVTLAKKLGVEYDPKTEPGVFIDEFYPGSPPYFNRTSDAVTQAIKEYFATVPFTKADMERVAVKYGATQIFQPKSFYVSNNVTEMKKGLEKFTDQPEQYDGSPANFSPSFGEYDKSLARPFQFDDATLAKNKPSGESVPVIVPYSYAEKALGFEKLPQNAPAQEKLDRISKVRAGAPSLHPVACYRNSVSQEQITSALSAIKEAAQNKTNKDYVQPDLVYGLPDPQTCGPAVIKRDKRTAETKQKEARQAEFERGAVASVPPIQYKVQYQVVGIAPDAPAFGEGLSISSLLTTIAGSNLNNSWVMPSDMRNQMGSLLSSVSDPDYEFASYILEFSSGPAAKKFVDEVKCPLSTCKAPKREFYIMQMGSNSIIVDEMRTAATKGIFIAGLVVVALSALIMMGNIGRMITDSRRETAVFRAIGAKRLDITTIYIIYALIVALLVGIVGYMTGVVVAGVGNYIYGGEITAQALLSFGSNDMSRVFSLIGIKLQDMLIVIGLALIAAMVGSIIPLLRNVRRNPIRDMRDE